MANTGSSTNSFGERALIAALRGRAGAGSRDLRLGIGDDCAIVRPRVGEEIVVTTDFSLDGVHFRRDWHPPESAGHRCLARGLSDLAAMGARPVAAFLSMAVPGELLQAKHGRSWLDRFLEGLLALATRFHVPLAGGDTARAADRACFDVILLGTVRRGRALLRSDAKAGDFIYVTGALGGAAAELLALEDNPRKFTRLTQDAANHPHLYPEPRLAAAAKLAPKIRAAIDVSDGLSTDLQHLCEESGLSAELDSASVPIHPLALKAEQAGRAASALDLALNGGEDYELLFTAAPDARIPSSVAGVAVHHIGQMGRAARRPHITLHNANQRATLLEAGGWEHFRRA